MPVLRAAEGVGPYGVEYSVICKTSLFFTDEHDVESPHGMKTGYRLAITEQKTGKQRVFTVPLVIYQYMENYCLRNGIGRTALLFPITTREVQKVLARVCDYLGYEGISTHSFRKWYATEIYVKNGYDIALVQRLLQHSSASVTQRYIGIEPQRIEKAIEGHAELI